MPHDNSSRSPTTIIRFDRVLRECVVYCPPHRQAICIEPDTFVPVGLAVQDRGLDTGLCVLTAGEACDAIVRIRYRWLCGADGSQIV